MIDSLVALISVCVCGL